MASFVEDDLNRRVEKLLASGDFELKHGVYCFAARKLGLTKLNRVNVLEDLGRGIVWKNVYAHYFRLLFAMKWTKRGATVVDVGCGRAWLRDLLFHNRVRSTYIGIDLSDASLTHASRKQYSYPSMLIRADCKRLPLKNDVGDVVVCYEMLEHNSKRGAIRILQECYRVCCPGGQLLVSTPVKRGNRGVFPEDHVYEWRLNEMTDALKSLGLDILSIHGCFGQSSALVPSLSPAELDFYAALKGYFDWNVLSALLAIRHPNVAQGAVWSCRKADA
jgi:ubiquinone/menaquinone biosynthesis C-methylase UbiE